jgi:hypothetical protein
MGLDQQSRFWATPNAHNAQGEPGAGHTANKGHRRDLVRESLSWPTPAARDHKGSPAELTRQDGKSRLDQLDRVAENFSPSAPATSDGLESSPTSRGSRRRLNPAFAAWLMGWPWWLTNPARINCAQSAMALYRCRLRMRLLSLQGKQV